MSCIVSESLNKGVPVNAPVIIRQIDLLEVCEDKKAISKIIDTQFEKYINYLLSLGDHTDLEVFKTMMVDIDEDTLERKLIFSPTGFFSTLAYNLNYDNVCSRVNNVKPILYGRDSIETFDNLREIFGKRLEVLSKLKNPDELRKEFPFLYNKYQLRMRHVMDMKKLFIELSSRKMNRSQKRAFIKHANATFKKSDPTFDLEREIKKANCFNFSTFTNEYVAAIGTLVDNAGKVARYLYSIEIDLSGLGEIDKEKLDLFFAYQFLVSAEMVNEEDKQDFLYYVSNYFTEHKDMLNSDLSIVVGKHNNSGAGFIQASNKEGIIITPGILYDRYRDLLVSNPNLRAIDFSHLSFDGMTASEVKAFMTEYLKDLSANWDFLAPDDRSYEKEIINKIKQSGSGMSEEEKQRHQERLLELFMRKKELYDSSDPFFRVKGKGTFDGYIGNIYSNGRVVLDTFYDNADSGKIADGHAIYGMGVQELYELSRLSKTEIIRNKLCNRYIHRGNWEQKVLDNEINAPAVGNPAVEVKQLIKKGEVEGA